MREERIQNPMRPFSGQDLREWRTSFSFSQAQLARMLDVPVNTIARWEREEIQIAQPRVLALALQAISSSLIVQQTIAIPVD